MSGFTIISGDFVKTGGMDRPNYQLATYLVRAGHNVELVAHRVAPDLVARDGLIFRRVSKPAGSYFLGSPLLSRRGKRAARNRIAGGGIVIANGGNCPLGDANWVHYVHAAYSPRVESSFLRRLKSRIQRAADLRAERTALRIARVVVCNSNLTSRQATELCGVDPARAKTIYYGVDSDAFSPASEEDRVRLRSRFGLPDGRPVVAFVGGWGTGERGSTRSSRRGSVCPATGPGTRCWSSSGRAANCRPGSLGQRPLGCRVPSASLDTVATYRTCSGRPMRWSRRPGTRLTEWEFTKRCAAACRLSSQHRPASQNAIRWDWPTCSFRTPTTPTGWLIASASGETILPECGRSSAPSLRN